MASRRHIIGLRSVYDVNAVMLAALDLSIASVTSVFGKLVLHGFESLSLPIGRQRVHIGYRFRSIVGSLT